MALSLSGQLAASVLRVQYGRRKKISGVYVSRWAGGSWDINAKSALPYFRKASGFPVAIGAGNVDRTVRGGPL